MRSIDGENMNLSFINFVGTLSDVVVSNALLMTKWRLYWEIILGDMKRIARRGGDGVSSSSCVMVGIVGVVWVLLLCTFCCFLSIVTCCCHVLFHCCTTSLSSSSSKIACIGVVLLHVWGIGGSAFDGCVTWLAPPSEMLGPPLQLGFPPSEMILPRIFWAWWHFEKYWTDGVVIWSVVV